MSIFDNLFKKNRSDANNSVLLKETAAPYSKESVYGNKLSLKTLSADVYKGLTFLIVDDSPDQLAILCTFLKNHGANVDFAENGKTGVGLYLANPGKYDIIFMDIQMPVMNGDEAAEQIRSSQISKSKTIPIVAISGNLSPSLAAESSFTFSLNKPFNIEQLAYIISCIIENI